MSYELAEERDYVNEVDFKTTYFAPIIWYLDRKTRQDNILDVLCV